MSANSLGSFPASLVIPLSVSSLFFCQCLKCYCPSGFPHKLLSFLTGWFNLLLCFQPLLERKHNFMLLPQISSSEGLRWVSTLKSSRNLSQFGPPSLKQSLGQGLRCLKFIWKDSSRKQEWGSKNSKTEKEEKSIKDTLLSCNHYGHRLTITVYETQNSLSEWGRLGYRPSAPSTH